MRCVIIGSAEINNYEKIRSYLQKDDFFIYCDGGLNHKDSLGFQPNLIIGDFDSFPREMALRQAQEPLMSFPDLIGESRNSMGPSTSSGATKLHSATFNSNTALSEQTSTVPEEISAVPEEISAVHEQTSTVHEQTSAVPEPVEGCAPEIIQLPCEKDDTDVFYAVKEALRRGFKDFLLIGVIGQRFDHSLVNISVLLYLEQQGCSGLILDDYSEMELIGKEPVQILGRFSYFSLLCIDGNVRGVTIKNAKYPLDNAEITTGYQYGVSNEVLPGKTAEVSVQQGKLLLIKCW